MKDAAFLNGHKRMEVIYFNVSWCLVRWIRRHQAWGFEQGTFYVTMGIFGAIALRTLFITVKIAKCRRRIISLLHSAKFINLLNFIVNINLFGAALSGHPFQKLFHIPDLLIAGRLTGFDKSASVLIIQGSLEQVDFALAQIADKCCQGIFNRFR